MSHKGNYQATLLKQHLLKPYSSKRSASRLTSRIESFTSSRNHIVVCGCDGFWVQLCCWGCFFLFAHRFMVCVCVHVKAEVASINNYGGDWWVGLDEDRRTSLAASILSSMFQWQCQMCCLLVPLIQMCPFGKRNTSNCSPSLWQPLEWLCRVCCRSDFGVVEGYV